MTDRPRPLNPQTQLRMTRQARRDTGPELAVRRQVRLLGRRYRIDYPGLPGKPDLANSRGRWAIFVHGCFWHQHPGCSRATRPRNNAGWWESKFAANEERDSRKIEQLRSQGFRVLVIWECQTRDEDSLRRSLLEWFEEQVEQETGPSP